MSYLAIAMDDMWVKGAISSGEESNLLVKKVMRSSFACGHSFDLTKAIQQVILLLQVKAKDITWIAISTTEVVDYAGSKIISKTQASELLNGDQWREQLEHSFHCKVSLLNFADASAIGLAMQDDLEGNRTIGIMPVGSSLGFSVWKNGRRWRPGKLLTLLGSVSTPMADYKDLSSTSKLAALDPDKLLVNVLTEKRYQKERQEYLRNLINIIFTSCVLYGLDQVILSGEIAASTQSCNYPLERELTSRFAQFSDALGKPINIIVAQGGGRFELIGALALAQGEAVAFQHKYIPPYRKIPTETPYNKDLQLQNMKTEAIIKLLWRAENEAGEDLENSLPEIALVADKAVKRIKKGGRIIYVGAGSSGRIAAMDAVEIPCTYGFPEDKVLAIVAGGISDAAIEIESNFEEDASAVPEMLLLNIKPEDTIIGISASGSAYYVQSALAFARNKGALAVMVQSQLPDRRLLFCDCVISLRSGHEVIAGSTRMKAGTATKKILNFLSSTIMIKMGKVAGSYMIDMACINNKLIERAKSILKIVYEIDEVEAMQRLEASNMNLYETIQHLDQPQHD